jgi:hypothetical protein
MISRATGPGAVLERMVIPAFWRGEAIRFKSALRWEHGWEEVSTSSMFSRKRMVDA